MAGPMICIGRIRVKKRGLTNRKASFAHNSLTNAEGQANAPSHRKVQRICSWDRIDEANLAGQAARKACIFSLRKSSEVVYFPLRYSLSTTFRKFITLRHEAWLIEH